LEKRANVDCGDENGWTPLHHCAVRGGKGRREVAEMILSKAGADVDSRTAYFRTPLHLACIGPAAAEENEGREEIKGVGGEEDMGMVNLLLQHGASMEAVDAEGCTALHRAAEQGRVKCVWKLIESGCDLYAKTPRRWNCLHYAR